jgi:hypothetical protein
VKKQDYNPVVRLILLVSWLVCSAIITVSVWAIIGLGSGTAPHDTPVVSWILLGGWAYATWRLIKWACAPQSRNASKADPQPTKQG